MKTLLIGVLKPFRVHIRVLGKDLIGLGLRCVV